MAGRWPSGLLLLLSVSQLAPPASAHEIWPGAPPVIGAALHHVQAPELVLLILAGALVAGSLARCWHVALAVPVLAVGLGAGLVAQPLLIGVSGLWRLPLLLSALAGLSVAAGVRGSTLATIGLLAVLAVATGLGIPRERPGLSGALEAWLAACLLNVFAALLLGLPQQLVRHRSMGLAARIAGAWIAAISLLGLAASLR